MRSVQPSICARAPGKPYPRARIWVAVAVAVLFISPSLSPSFSECPCGQLEASPDTEGLTQVRRHASAAWAGKTPAERTAALGALGDALTRWPATFPAAAPGLRKALHRGAGPIRAAVVLAASRAGTPEALAFVLERLDPAEEQDARVWSAVMRALAPHGRRPDVGRLLASTLGKARASPPHRALLLEAVGVLSGPLPRLHLARGRSTETWVEVAGRARGLAQQEARWATEALIGMLRHASLAARVQAWEALVARTHCALTLEPAGWERWWANGAGAAADAPRYAEDAPRHIPRYYGIPIPRPRAQVVFCLDSSQSMYGDGITFARMHLKQTLSEMPSTQSFEIIAFHERLQSFGTRLVRAHPVQKWRAAKWLDALETIAYTNLYDALELAFGLAGRGPARVLQPQALDMIFVLSDGAPNRGRYRVAERIISHAGTLADGSLPLHTIGVGRRDEQLLRGLAAACGGTYVDVVE